MTTYDTWKSTNPADQWLGPDPDDERAPVKVHLILKGMALCNTPPREGGYQAVTTAAEFEAVEPCERCRKCCKALAKIRMGK
jgi:hypothetical protein